jgi:uncharacterized protein (DUF1800 family)
MPEPIVVIPPPKVVPPPPPDNSTLDVYVPRPEKPWNLQRVSHLFRRLGFGASPQQLQQALSMSPSELIDQLLDNAATLGTPLPPYWANYTSANYSADPDQVFVHRRELVHRWMSEMLDEGVRAKMALFWHNHFVTELDVVECNAYLWSYYSLIHEYAFGNFRTFVRKMGENPAMLVYLNGNTNAVGQPNENYARELMELFTMGESNGYTQSDIVNMARALTGWQATHYACTPPFFNPARFDSGQKTIFGQTANFNFTTAHNLIFSARAEQTSRYICGKFYKHFVYQHLDSGIVDELAAIFRNNNWEILPVLKTLLKSEHFFEERFVNVHIKTPLDAMLPLFKMAGANSAEHMEEQWWDAVAYWSGQLGQAIFNPPNVAGWPGYHKWLNESTLTTRWSFATSVAYLLSTKEPLRETLRYTAIGLTNESNDPNVIVPALVYYFTGQTLEPVHYLAALSYFKANIPQNYFDDGSWNLYWDEAPYQIVNMLYYLVRLPEYQLT